MARYAMVTDLRKCVACQACTVACNAEWDVPAGSRADPRPRRRRSSGTFPKLCVQRLRRAVQPLRPPAVRRGVPVGRDVPGRRTASCASTRRVCIGCGFCVDACPYDARFINPATKKVDKCDFCAVAHRARRAAGLRGDLHRPRQVLRRPRGPAAARSSGWSTRRARAGSRRATVAVGPNVYYLGKPEHLDLVAGELPAAAAAAAGGRRGLEPRRSSRWCWRRSARRSSGRRSRSSPSSGRGRRTLRTERHPARSRCRSRPTRPRRCSSGRSRSTTSRSSCCTGSTPSSGSSSW